MKNKFYINLLLFCIFSVTSSSQEFDQAFLKSLPEDVASDLIERSSKKNASEETQYRRPSTFIVKPEPTSNRFGAKVFSMMQSSLMPLNEPNFDGSYTLDFGDELELQLTGQKSSITKLFIKRDGSINIKDIGKLYLAGLSLKEAISLIKTKVSQSYIGVDAYITLLNVRDIQIIIAGNVYNPGSYTLNGNSNTFSALVVAGGPSEFGSFRSIDLIRNNKIIESVDLYQTFIFGLSNFNTRLRSGDTVFVNPVNNIVSINGSVRRPGDYELIKNENLSTALLFSNGLDKFADLGGIKLERILDGKIKQIPISNISQFNKILPNDGDSIIIRSFKFRSINITGAVVNPGTYLMNEGDKISDAILKAGGYTPNAYPFGGVYENLETEAINKKATDQLYTDLLDSIITLSQSNSSDNSNMATTLELTSQLRDADVSGRVIADFKNNAIESEILIQDGDKINIPEYMNQVHIYGEVLFEGSASYQDGEGVLFYLSKKGGLSSSADLKNIFVVQPNGETEKISLNRNVFKNQAKDIKIYAGSIIFIPRKLENKYGQRMRAQAYATILGNLGVSLASISVLKD